MTGGAYFSASGLFEAHAAMAALDVSAFEARAVEAAHLACALMCFGGYDDAETIGDKGLIHELLHVALISDDPVINVRDIKMRFDALAIGWIDAKCAPKKPPVSSDDAP
jgi:hypothetical protein